LIANGGVRKRGDMAGKWREADNAACAAMQPRSVIAALCAALALLLPAVASAELRARPPTGPAMACIVAPMTLNPIFPAPPAPLAQDEDDQEDEEEDEEEEDDEDNEDEDDEDTLRGLKLPGHLPGQGPCIGFSGSVTAGMQYSLASSRGVHKLIVTPADRVSFLPSATIRLAASQETSLGARLDAVIGLNLLPSSDPAAPGVEITEAKIDFGGWTFGYDFSRFNFWEGDAFLFGTRVPARNALMLSRMLQLTEGWSMSAGFEDPRKSANQTLFPGVPTGVGITMPDVVGQAAYEGDTLRLHLAGAVRQHTRSSRLDKKTWGVAGIGGLEWSFDALAGSHRLTMQAAWAHDAPGYLGTQADRRTLASLLSADDTTTGYSLLGALSRDWTDTLTTNIYVSHLRIDLPRLGTTGGRGDLSRGAANIVWTPVKGLRLGLEGGVSTSKLDLPNRAIGDLAGRQTTAILWMDRAF
jgi:hypothetical protein